jgi:hypothetical protein
VILGDLLVDSAKRGVIGFAASQTIVGLSAGMLKKDVRARTLFGKLSGHEHATLIRQQRLRVTDLQTAPAWNKRRPDRVGILS